MQLMSDQIDQLATALAKAQGEMPVAAKNCKNPFFKSLYADFEAIRDACVPSLSKYGLSFIQSVCEDESGSTCLITQLQHSSGQWIRSKAKISPTKNDIQSISSYNTYLKRMCLSSLVGVATGEADDDGEAAVDRPSHTPTNYNRNEPYASARQVHESIVEVITEHELAYLKALGKETQAGILEKYNVEALKDLNRKQYAVIEQRIEDNKKKIKEAEKNSLPSNN